MYYIKVTRGKVAIFELFYCTRFQKTTCFRTSFPITPRHLSGKQKAMWGRIQYDRLFFNAQLRVKREVIFR